MRSFLAAPLTGSSHTSAGGVGSLNIYSDDPTGFTATEIDLVAVGSDTPHRPPGSPSAFAGADVVLVAPAHGVIAVAQSGEGLDVGTFPRWVVYLVWALLLVAVAIWLIRRRRG